MSLRCNLSFISSDASHKQQKHKENQSIRTTYWLHYENLDSHVISTCNNASIDNTPVQRNSQFYILTARNYVRRICGNLCTHTSSIRHVAFFERKSMLQSTVVCTSICLTNIDHSINQYERNHTYANYFFRSFNFHVIIGRKI